MKSFLLGRGLDCDVVFADPTVSRRHAEFVVKSEREFLLVDSASTYGTFVRSGQEWKQITTAQVSIDDQIRLGRHDTSVRAVMSAVIEKLRASAPADEKPPPASPSSREPVKRAALERDPETGEIIRRE
ncbi:FHA domain-containing protein [Bradyrhizobium sp.]|uniref:FHA domain-containing protein n=1 Tax=Bradyrhizobium sp. TaxID=376 RepID=UPI0040384A11